MMASNGKRSRKRQLIMSELFTLLERAIVYSSFQVMIEYINRSPYAIFRPDTLAHGFDALP